MRFIKRDRSTGRDGPRIQSKAILPRIAKKRSSSLTERRDGVSNDKGGVKSVHSDKWSPHWAGSTPYNSPRNRKPKSRQAHDDATGGVTLCGAWVGMPGGWTGRGRHHPAGGRREEWGTGTEAGGRACSQR